MLKNFKTIKISNDLFPYLVIFFSAFIFRISIFYFGIFEINSLTSDSYEYLNIAKSIEEFGVYGIEGIIDMNRAPTYPSFIFLSKFFIFSEIKNIIFIQILLDAINCCLIFYISNQYQIKKIFKIILFILLVSCLYTASYALMIMTETIYSFLITLSLFIISIQKRFYSFLFDIKISKLLIFAIILVLIVLTRPIFILTIFFFLLISFFYILIFEYKNFTNNILKIIVFGMFMSLIISPWIIRNIYNFSDDIFTKNSIATPIGYKTNYNMWKPFYMKEYKEFLKSYEEPFLLLSPIEPPKIAKYLYTKEKEDIKKAFDKLNKIPNLKNGKSGKQLEYNDDIRNSFKLITEKRYDQKPILFITAPISRILKILFAPRISTFYQNESGFNSSKFRLILFSLYNCAYVLLGLFFFFSLKNFKTNRLVFIFIFSLISSHVYAYTIWVPAPQSRYLIPLFPIFALLTCLSLDRIYKKFF